MVLGCRLAPALEHVLLEGPSLLEPLELGHQLLPLELAALGEVGLLASSDGIPAADSGQLGQRADTVLSTDSTADA